MAGIIKSHIQLGDSTTATNNFMLTAQAADGTVKLSRGNNGATTQDILTVDAAGRVAFPQSLVVFMAYQSVSQTAPVQAYFKLQFQTEEADTNNAFSAGTVVTDGDLTNRFTPQVPGFYQISGAFHSTTATTEKAVAIFKNGGIYKQGINIAATATYGVNVLALVYLNGTTDYVDLRGYTSIAASIGASIQLTYFQGILVAKA